MIECIEALAREVC